MRSDILQDHAVAFLRYWPSVDIDGIKANRTELRNRPYCWNNVLSLCHIGIYFTQIIRNKFRGIGPIASETRLLYSSWLPVLPSKFMKATPNGRTFGKYRILVLLVTSVATLHFWLKLDKSERHCAGGPSYVTDLSPWLASVIKQVCLLWCSRKGGKKEGFLTRTVPCDVRASSITDCKSRISTLKCCQWCTCWFRIYRSWSTVNLLLRNEEILLCVLSYCFQESFFILRPAAAGLHGVFVTQSVRLPALVVYSGGTAWRSHFTPCFQESANEFNTYGNNQSEWTRSVTLCSHWLTSHA
jgi:hypothetical protein